MSTSYRIKSSPRHPGSVTSIVMELGPDVITFEEQMLMPGSSTIHRGRLLRVESIEGFERAAGYTAVHLDEFMLDRQASGKLTLDYLHRLCERHRVPYGLTGARLTAVYTRYLRTHKAGDDPEFVRGRTLYAQALAYALDHNLDADLVVAMLTEAANIGFKRAYMGLALFHFVQGDIPKAFAAAEAGVAQGDPGSMAALAYFLSKDVLSMSEEMMPAPPDYVRAAELYFAAIDAGELQEGLEGIKRLMDSGVYTPKANTYMKLVSLSARARRQEYEAGKAALGADPAVLEAYRNLTRTPVRPDRARNLLIQAYDRGRTDVCALLARICIEAREYGTAARFALAGAEAGHKDCYFYLAKLCHLGADFAEFYHRLGQPDHQGAAAWSVRAIEAGDLRGEQFLDRYLKRGVKINAEEIMIEKM